MGKYMRKRKETGEVAAVMEVSSQVVGVRTRSKTLAMASSSSAKRKICGSGESQSRTRRRILHNMEEDRTITIHSVSDLVSSSQCSSNGSSELIDKSTKGDRIGVETSASTCLINNRERRETTPLSDLQNWESTAMEASDKMPTDDEINDFFTDAEKKEQKRFSDKYNYDIVNDVPLEGRYEWIPLTP
ncbi:hypothetical protein GIB67_010723 [Kingdonia uniflora]|uniref:Cyclin-dependent kinase inhibitor domain-containing protein n=1 Tax=Kingdonia uniflora TaxID=39325 RepID=A0A7J7L8N1_9MAGN|nr:hypothetical protein GIB67_010723 [Kingdonia uniflora]